MTTRLFFLILILWLTIAGSAHATTPLAACPSRNAPSTPTYPPCQAGFPVAVTELGNDSITHSSPTIADLDGDGLPEIIVGTDGGYVVALHQDGSLYWKLKVSNAPVQSKPAVADINGDGRPEVVVGAGSGNVVGGGVYVISYNGLLQCKFDTLNPQHPQGVYSSPALGHLDPSRPTKMQIAFGSFDFRIRAIDDSCNLFWEKGQADYVVDTVWSSPALYDLDGDGNTDVIIGQDSNPQTIGGFQTPAGGMLRAFRGNGTGELPGFPLKFDDVIYSSPAIGDILGVGGASVVTGSGRCWDLNACNVRPIHATTKAVLAFSATGQALPGWPHATPYESSRTASPALADLNGDGKLETVINTISSQPQPADGADILGSGNVHVLRSDGTEMPGWPRQPNIPASCTPGDTVHNGTEASPIIADIDGDGWPEIILPAANEFVIWDRLGNQLSATSGCPPVGTYSLWSGSSGFFSSAAVADLDHNGRLELVGAGTNGNVPGHSGAYATVYAWTFPNSNANASNSMPWPAFRHDARNTGVYTPDRIFKNGFD